MSFESATFDAETTGIPQTKVNFETQGAGRGFVLRVSNLVDTFDRNDCYAIQIHRRELVAGSPHGHGSRVYDLVQRWIRQTAVAATLWEYYIRESEMGVRDLLDRLTPYQLRDRQQK
jgi:hypothetical protein